MGDIVMSIIKIISLFVNIPVLMICLPRRKSVWFTILLSAAYGCVTFIFELLSNELGQLQVLMTIWFIPLAFFMFKAPFFQILFALVIPVFLTVSEQLFAEAMIRFFVTFDTPLYWSLYLTAVLILTAVHIFFVVRYGKTLLNKMFIQGRKWEWALYSFSAIFSITVMMFLYNALIESDTVTFLLALLFTVWSYIILCFAVINTHEKSKQKYEADFARDIISSGQEHYTKMNELFDKIRIMRHDYKYHLNVMQGLLQSGETEKANKYMDILQLEFQNQELKYYCSNAVVNTLIANYTEKYEKAGIEFNMEINSVELSIPDYDMCIILGNLLENAFEACQYLNNNKKIDLLIKAYNNKLCIKIKNNFDGTVTKNENGFLSTKKDGGLGLKSVKAVALRYYGDLIIEWNDDVFTASVIMKMEGDKISE